MPRATMAYETAIQGFLETMWSSYSHHVLCLHPEARLEPIVPDERLYTSDCANYLRIIRRAADGEIEYTPDNVAQVRQACQRVARLLFGLLPEVFHIPPVFVETPMGALWWRAMNWCEGEELITLTEAAEIAGVSVQAISASRSLTFFTDPLARGRVGRRLVRKTDVLALGKRKGDSFYGSDAAE